MAILRRNVSAQSGVQSVFHDLRTTDLLVQVRNQAGQVVLVDTTVTSPNSVEIEFDEQFAGETYDVFLSY